MSGEAMQMRIELAKLAVRHGAANRPHVIPLADPIDGPVTIEGFASTADIDLEFTRFRGWSFNNPCLLLSNYARPPLLYRHDENQIAGKIESLTYDDRGRLRIRAHVTHEQAARCGAFSIRATINAYELRDVDSSNFHALVTSAEIVEVSLTDRPGNPHALVQRRYRAAPVAPLLDRMAETNALFVRGVGVIQKMAQLIHQQTSQRAEAPPAGVSGEITGHSLKVAAPNQYRQTGVSVDFNGHSVEVAPPAAPHLAPPNLTRRPTPFSQFVEELNRVHQH